MRPALATVGVVPPTTAGSPRSGEEGSASLELVGVLPFLLLAVLVAAQLAIAGALALVGGHRGAGGGAGGAGRRRRGAAARAALPPALRRGREVGTGAARSRSRCRVPRLLPGMPPVGVEREDEARRRWIGRRGQATVELVAALPALLLAGYVAFQLLAAGYALTLADGAAEAGALALASGRPASAAARDALPGWADEDVEVSVSGGRVTVRLRPPSLAARDRRAPRGDRARPRRGRDERCGTSSAGSRSSSAGRRGRGLARARRGARLRRLRARPGGAPARADRRTAPPRPALVASAAARARSRSASPPTCRRRGSRRAGRICHLTLPAGREGLERAPAALRAGPRLARRRAPAAGPAAGRRGPSAGSDPVRRCSAPTSDATGR